MGGRRIALGLSALLVTVGVAGTAAATDGAGTPVPLVERSTCAAPDGRFTAAPAGPGETRVQFDVPAVTRLRVEAESVVAAATNTGCAPRSTDAFVVGTRSATAEEVAAALADFASGDWRQPGGWHLAEYT